MFLELSVDSIDPIVFALHTKTEVIIGSLPTSDLVLNDPSISRKHARFYYSEKKWFISDLGSTNGTFLNEQQIIPGKKEEVTEGAIIRLGYKVELTFLKEAKNAQPLYASSKLKIDPKQEERHNKTQIISIAALKAAKAASDKKKLKKRQEKRLFELKARKEEKTRNKHVAIIVSVVLFLGIGLNRLWVQNMKKQEKEGVFKKMENRSSSDSEIEAELEGLRIPKGELLHRSHLIGMIQNPKCLSEQEKVLCEKFSFAKNKSNGVIKLEPRTYIMVVDRATWIKKAETLLGQRKKISARMKEKIMYLNFMKEHFSTSMQEFNEETRLYVAFYSPGENALTLNSVGGMISVHLASLLEKYDEEAIKKPEILLDSVIDDLDVYYKLF